MDVGATIKITASISQGAQGSFARPAPASAQQVVVTELPASQTVSAAANGAAIRNDLPRVRGLFTQDVEIDYYSRELVFRLKDERSGVVVQQVPAEALLRLRAYARAIADGKTPTQALYQANLRV